jgi:RNA polymerase sigma factor (sigma-70 family)
VSEREQYIQAEQELVDKVLEGDRNAITTFFETYRRLVYGVILKSQFDQSNADDLFQEFFKRLMENDWRKLRGWNAQSRLSTYLVSILRNFLIDEARKKKDTVALDDERALSTDPMKEAEKKMDLRTLKQKLAECCRKLPERDQKIYARRFVDEASTTQIAEEMGLTPNATYQAIHSTKARLTRCMKEEYPFLFSETEEPA